MNQTQNQGQIQDQNQGQLLDTYEDEQAPAETPAGATGRKRNLGGAVVLAAIEDYRGVNEEAFLDAQRFLYPRTPHWQTHFNWVVAMAEGVDRAWLRDRLDRMRDQWDGERLRKMERRRRTGRCA